MEWGAELDPQCLVSAEFDPPMFTSHPSACMHRRNLTLPVCAHQQQACHQIVVYAIGQLKVCKSTLQFSQRKHLESRLCFPWHDSGLTNNVSLISLSIVTSPQNVASFNGQSVRV